jgi:hypothetical protein
MGVIDRVPQLANRGATLKQMLRDKLIEHKHYIEQHGQDMPEVRNWQWTPRKADEAGVIVAANLGPGYEPPHPRVARRAG